MLYVKHNSTVILSVWDFVLALVRQSREALVIAEGENRKSHYVVRHACLGRKLTDPHHLRFTQPRALGHKASDEFVVPHCRIHHRAAHRAGDERAWWKSAGIDPIKIAPKL